ncbi:ComF family protein [Shewanella saliphila]|uniref:Amidophosphoribosyltransferase n=1 Tax=Shewanella saliphila TaxID=2282698 RepID=A0ABQ2Q3R1_9GAMM|nr:ComF family protein [Shewanella saliphila]MCL1101055.1 ComF family protein [Shewanella saliphila]GGP44289.1 amidophosphoribosyltransferase [Shewanella saliphila]
MSVTVFKRKMTGLVEHSKSVYQFANVALLSSLPNRCQLCQHRIEQLDYQRLFPNQVLSGICQVCLAASLYQHEVCLGCGREIALLQAYCGKCLKLTPMLVVAPCSYHQGLGPLIAAIKYQQQCAPLNAITQQLATRINQLIEHKLIRAPQVLVPVPLHPNRLRQRGFNQAWLIANRLSQLLDIPLDDSSLTRVVDTAPQADLSGKQRRKNCFNAFELSDKVQYQRVALIDDVVTTGTTVDEIARLFSQQFIYVQTWCLARAEAPGLLD